VLTGDGLHVVVDDAARRIPEFEARLKRAHVPFDAIQQVTPTIEDLFVDAVSSGRDSGTSPMPEDNNSVVIENLVKRFGDFVAVDHINLKIRKGEVFGFLGPNGAGKSTTIRMLCGLLTPTSGRAQVAGYDVGREPESVRQNIGYMSQKFSLYNDLKVIENIAPLRRPLQRAFEQTQERIEWALEMANLKGQENLITGTLPGGMEAAPGAGLRGAAQTPCHLSG
jgi:ABC-type bacteriocin/lantibiotic exporter with double-glycine peptidase domain